MGGLTVIASVPSARRSADEDAPFRRETDRVHHERQQITDGPAESNAERDDVAEGLMEGLISGINSNGSAEDRELELFRPILERLASRQDIPEAFWVSAGLTRVMAQRGEEERR